MNAWVSSCFPTELHCLVSGRLASNHSWEPISNFTISCHEVFLPTWVSCDPPTSCAILPLMIQYHAEVVCDWRQLKIYTYFTLHCPIILYECPNIDRRAWSLPLKRTVSWKRQTQIYSPTELFVSSLLWDPWASRQKSSLLCPAQSWAHSGCPRDCTELESAQKKSSWETCLHKGNCHASRTPLGSFFYEVMVKVKGIRLYLETLKDNNPT